MAKLEIIFCAAGLALLLLLKFAILDSAERHQRVWQECQLMAVMNERQRHYNSAEPLYRIALKEAEALGQSNPRTAFTLADLGLLDCHLKKYNEAMNSLNAASAIIQPLLKNGSADCDKRLLASESVRIELQKAICFERLNQKEQAKEAYLQTLRTFNLRCLYASQTDLASLVRMKEAFCAYCKLTSPPESFAAASTLLKEVSWSEVSKRITPQIADVMISAFREMIDCAPGTQDEKASLCHQLESTLQSSMSSPTNLNKYD